MGRDISKEFKLEPSRTDEAFCGYASVAYYKCISPED